ncbi:hypothetical protein T01_12553, partial [Trichinella spiralis]
LYQCYSMKTEPEHHSRRIAADAGYNNWRRGYEFASELVKSELTENRQRAVGRDDGTKDGVVCSAEHRVSSNDGNYQISHWCTSSLQSGRRNLGHVDTAISQLS